MTKVQFTFPRTAEVCERYRADLKGISPFARFEVSRVEDYFRTIRSIREQRTLPPSRPDDLSSAAAA
jgi:hypothetical protein